MLNVYSTTIKYYGQSDGKLFVIPFLVMFYPILALRPLHHFLHWQFPPFKIPHPHLPGLLPEFIQLGISKALLLGMMIFEVRVNLLTDPEVSIPTLFGGACRWGRRGRGLRYDAEARASTLTGGMGCTGVMGLLRVHDVCATWG